MTITIIGGGASGILLTVNLIKHAGADPLEINLIEKNERFGGVAYGMAKDFHLLNVPAAKMGAFPDDVEHFYRWLESNNFNSSPNDFVSRRIYLEYLQQILIQTLENKSPNVTVKTFADEAVDVADENGAAKVLLESGETLRSDKVVLAFGNFLPPHVRTEANGYTASSRYFQNPWSEDIPGKIAKTEDVLIIGTGLTGVDVMMSLRQNEHAGKIYAVSTHGWLPTVHSPAQPYPSFETEIAAQSKITEMLKTVRRHVEQAEADGNNWRAVIDSMRSYTPQTWLRLPQTEKRRFMRHLQRRWDVSRHRMPPDCFAVIEELRETGQLEILPGRIRKIETHENPKFEVFFGNQNTIAVDYVVNCTGSQANYLKIDQPLVKNLTARGAIRPDALFLGLDAVPAGNLNGADGEPSQTLYTFGTALRGILWETTAMPEIRAQARDLAMRLLS